MSTDPRVIRIGLLAFIHSASSRILPASGGNLRPAGIWERKMRAKLPGSVIAVMGLMVLPMTVDAAARCPAGKDRCTVEQAAALGQTAAVEPKAAALVPDFGQIPQIAGINTVPEGQTY